VVVACGNDRRQFVDVRAGFGGFHSQSHSH
jgi:hypothetical protein